MAAQDHLELHVFSDKRADQGGLVLQLAGDTFHNVGDTPTLIDAGGEVVFRGRYDKPATYGATVEGLHWLFRKTHCFRMEIGRTRVNAYFEPVANPDQGAYQKHGPRLVDGVVQILEDTKGKHVELDGDPDVFALEDTRREIRTLEEESISIEDLMRERLGDV